jgi:hypothetical protein
MKFLKTISIVAAILISSISCAQALTAQSLKAKIDSEFGKNYQPFYKNFRQAPLVPEYYKVNKIKVPTKIENLYKSIDTFYFINFCSLLDIPDYPKDNRDLSEAISGLAIVYDFRYIKNLTFSEVAREKEFENLKYFSDKYKKALKYYRFIKAMDPEEKLTTEYSEVSKACLKEVFIYKEYFNSFKKFEEKALLDYPIE